MNTPYDPNNWAQRLADQARILGEARMLRDEQPLTEELTATILTRLHELLKRSGKSAEWAARSMGISASTLSQLIGGKYAGDVEKQIRALDKWIEGQILRETAPKPGGFVRTRIAEQIYGVARWVSEINAIGVVHGPAGIGKTITAEAIRAETPGSVMITIVRPGLRQLPILQSIADGLRMGGLTLTVAQMFKQICGVLKDTNRLLIVDEIHRLEGRCQDDGLHMLKDLHDQTKIPMLWLGMSNIAKYIQEGRTRYEPLDQIASRVKFWLDLTRLATGTDGGPGLYTIEDIRKWLNAQKIRISSDATGYLHMIANDYLNGGLRRCDGLVRVAMKLSKGEIIAASLLRSILAQQYGSPYVEALETRSGIELGNESAAAVG